MRLALASLVLAVVAGNCYAARPAEADQYDGFQLHNAIAASDDIMRGVRSTDTAAYDAFYMQGYVLGQTDALTRVGLLCTGGMHLGQQVAIIRKWLDANPEQWQLHASEVIARAMQGFACKPAIK